MQDPSAHVVSVHVGEPREYQWLGRTLTSSIVKHPVAGPIAISGVNLAGDDQADRAQHGGVDKVAYIYAAEDQAWWETELGRPLPAAIFGQNITSRGLDVTHAVIGERWRIGTALLQVTEPRTPCWKLGMRMGDKRFPRQFAAARRPGAHTRLLEPGEVSAGDPIVIEDRPSHGITVDDVFRVYLREDPDVGKLLRAPELAAHWRAWVEHRTVWHLDEEAKRGER